MIYVNKEGRRVANEKLAYNEMAQVFFQWDGAKSEYPNLLLIAVWDQRSQDHSASDEYGRFIVPPGTDDKHVIKGATLSALSKAVGERLARYAKVTGGLALAPDFEKTLASTIQRFTGFASGGRDFDFHRGERVRLLNCLEDRGPLAVDRHRSALLEAHAYRFRLVRGVLRQHPHARGDEPWRRVEVFQLAGLMRQPEQVRVG